MTRSPNADRVGDPIGVERGQRELTGLMGLRAVMGSWVVADHLAEPIIGLLPALAPLRPVLSGGIALDTFFILSGFVISHVYAARVSTFGPRAHREFLWARVARLWPTHVFALMVTAVLVAVFAARGLTYAPYHYSVGTFLGNLAMFQAVPGVDPWNGPSWSVSVEMAAYLLFPLFAGLVVRMRRGTAVALAMGVVASEMIVLPHMAEMSPTVVLASLIWVRPLGEFVLGCALWAAWRHGIRRHPGWDVVAVSALVGVAGTMYLASADPVGLSTYGGSCGWLRVLAVALLGVIVVAVTGATGPVHRLLHTRPVLWAGRTSYSRYLLHLPVLSAIAFVVPLNSVVHASWPVRAAAVLSWFAAVYVVGDLTHRFVEEPARRRLRRPRRRGRTGGGEAPVSSTSTILMPLDPTVPIASRSS